MGFHRRFFCAVRRALPYLNPCKTTLAMHLFRLTLLALLFLSQNVASGQISDDFSDGDFTQNPTWLGDAANFKVTGGELQLSATAAGQSALATGGNIADSTVWNLRFRLTFAPSAQNLLRIYLLADQANLASANGYFLEIGENGSADALRLFRQDGTTAKTLLATGQPGLVATNPDIQLRVKRKKSGDWEIQAATFGSALQPQLSVTDATYSGGPDRYFGFQCVYTVTNAARFFFDNISILPDIPDTKPPVLLSAQADDATHVTAVFDETLDSLSAVAPARYTVSSTGQPLAVSLLSGKNAVSLTLATPLATGSHTLQTSGLKDLAGNISATQATGFQFVKTESAAEFDIVINEIMADPSPSVGLPEVEWLELYNRSAKTIDLSTLRIADGSSAGAALPAYLMPPNSYAVLTAPANVAALRPFSGDTVLAAPLSTTALNNDGDLLTLSTAAGLIISRVDYRLDWHTASGKNDGGWSLERINPNVPCLGKANWQSCPALPGGTPGRVNASLNLTPDTTPPTLLDVFPESPTEIRLHFSEGLDAAAITNLAAYDISPARTLASAGLYPEERGSIRLLLAEPLAKQTVYTLTVEAPVADCSGNLFEGRDTVLIGLPEKPAPQDVVVNEVMFNPAPNGSRYVEFFNRSPKVFDWSEFFVASFSGTVPTVQVKQRKLSLPGQHQVFALNPADVLSRFDNVIEQNLVEQALPSMSDDAGNVVLYWVKNGQTVVLDSFHYSEDFHNALFNISEREGMALERIRGAGPTNDPANWTSAAPNLTGAPGSPTLPNSQRLDDLLPGAEDGLIELPSPARLSPDDDGREDFLDIRYSLPREGYAATMTIFDAEGTPLRRLARQQLIGTEGALRWDGDLDDGTKARPGIYVLFLEIFSPTGEVRREKRAVTVVNKW